MDDHTLLEGESLYDCVNDSQHVGGYCLLVCGPVWAYDATHITYLIVLQIARRQLHVIVALL